jgi:hypothetical protein
VRRCDTRPRVTGLAGGQSQPKPVKPLPATARKRVSFRTFSGASRVLVSRPSYICRGVLLLSVAKGDKSLIEAVAAYERVMLPRGFDTVDSSLRLASQLFGTDH